MYLTLKSMPWSMLFAFSCNPVEDPDSFIFGVAAFVVIVTIVSVALAVGFVIVIIVFLSKVVFGKGKTAAQGESAYAGILQVSDSGVTVKNNPKVVIRMQVEPEGRRPYQVQIDQVVSRIHLPRVQPGQRVPVIIDRTDPMKVALDLDRLVDGKPPEEQPEAPPIRCKYCGNTFKGDLERCPYCGAPSGAV